MCMFLGVIFFKLMHYSLVKKECQRKVSSEMSNQKKTALHVASYTLFIDSFQFYYISALHSIVNIGAHVLYSVVVKVKV